MIIFNYMELFLGDNIDDKEKVIEVVNHKYGGIIFVK